MDDDLVKTDWNKLAKKWILACKVIVMVFILCLIVTVTYENIPIPYCVFIIGIELALSVMTIFMFVRVSNTPKKRYRKGSD
jgi:hypothetical protein